MQSKVIRWIALLPIALGIAFAQEAGAHRTTGMLQSTLVEILPDQVGLELTLLPGMDIAPGLQRLLDLDGDGQVSEVEKEAFGQWVQSGQEVSVNGRRLPVKVKEVRVPPLNELAGGHATMVVEMAVELKNLSGGTQTIRCLNRFAPMESSYQCDGLVPKSSEVQVVSHRREEGQQALVLVTEFRLSVPSDPAVRLTDAGGFPSVWGLGWMLVGGVLYGAWRLRYSRGDAVPPNV